MKTEAETRALQLEANKCLESPEVGRCKEGLSPGGFGVGWGGERHSLAHILILDFWFPKL